MIIFLGSDEPEAGPSGIQKKARTVSSNEEVAEDTADNQDMESDVDEGAIETSSHHGTITSQAQDNLVQDQEDEITIPFSAEPVEEDETEEGEISEDGEEEEETPVPEEDVLAEDDAESGMEQEDGEADNVTPANDPDPEEPVEDVVEENSSEPSSSVGVAAPLQQSLPSVSSSQSAPGFEQDPVEDSVVPSTPKLAQPRRPLGFSEAVSSPQVRLKKIKFVLDNIFIYLGTVAAKMSDQTSHLLRQCIPLYLIFILFISLYRIIGFTVITIISHIGWFPRIRGHVVVKF